MTRKRRVSFCLAFGLNSLLLAIAAVLLRGSRWIFAPAGFFTAAISVFIWFLYGRWFNRSRFDVVPLKERIQDSS